MVSEDVITKGEIMNDGDIVHLYYNEMYRKFVAYGYSAYIVSHYKPIKSVEKKYSDELQMPFVIVNDEILKQLLAAGGRIIESNEGLYYKIQWFKLLDEDDYSKWATEIRDSLKK